MTLEQFVAKYDGKFVDVDNAFGDQCWDLVAAYNQEVIGIPASQGYGLPTGPDLAARDVWQYFLEPLGTYFDRVQHPFRRGDIIIWGQAIGKDGHIDIFLRDEGSGFVGFDQNWPIGSPAHQQLHNYTGILGGLRPKGGDMPTQVQVLSAFRQYGLEDPTQGQLDYYSSKPWSVLVEDLFNYVSQNETLDETAVNYGFQLGFNRDATADEVNYWSKKNPGAFLKALYQTRKTK